MKYSKSIRQEVFVKYVCGYTPKEIAKETGIHFATIYRWVNSWRKDLNDRPLTDLPLQDVGTILSYTEELKQRLEEAERTLSIIHTSGILQTIPLRQRIDMVLSLLDAYPVKFLAQAFEVSLSSIYYHRGQEQRKIQRQQQDEDMRSRIQEIFTENNGRIGAERIRILLHNQGVIVSKKKVIRFMKQLGLTSNTRSKIYYPSQSKQEEGNDVQILQ